ncbi:MAG: hypothetical protein ACP5SD_08445 [Elusimicrobiales bacterium]
MKKIKMKKDKFDFEVFVGETAKAFGGKKKDVCFILDPKYSLLKYPNDYKEVKAHIEKGDRIFVFFALGPELEEEDIYKADCADGKPLKIKEDSPAVYGEDEIVGYVVTLKDDNYIFESYLCESPMVCDHPPSFSKYSYKELNLRMENFLKKFTK